VIFDSLGASADDGLEEHLIGMFRHDFEFVGAPRHWPRWGTQPVRRARAEVAQAAAVLRHRTSSLSSSSLQPSVFALG